MRVAATGMEDQGFPGVPGQGLDPAEPVIYLSWTGDGPVMYLPYTCAGDALDHEDAVIGDASAEHILQDG